MIPFFDNITQKIFGKRLIILLSYGKNFLLTCFDESFAMVCIWQFDSEMLDVSFVMVFGIDLCRECRSVKFLIGLSL